MNTVTISDLKKHGAKSLAQDKTTYLIVNSKPRSAIVPIAEYEMLIQTLEELQDKKVVEERLTEPNINANEFFNDLEK